MTDELDYWAISTDPETITRVLEAWDAGRVPIEPVAHELGLAPDPAKGQRDEIFIHGTPDGQRIPMWEPGPGPYDHDEDDGPEDDSDALLNTVRSACLNPSLTAASSAVPQTQFPRFTVAEQF